MDYEQFRLEAVEKITRHCHLENTDRTLSLYTDGFTSEDPMLSELIDDTNRNTGHPGAKGLVGDYLVLLIPQGKNRSGVARFEVRTLYDAYREKGWEQVYEIVDTRVREAEDLDTPHLEDMPNYDAVRHRLILCLRNRANFKVRYGNFVFQRMDDMAIMLYFIVRDMGSDRIITPVPRRIFEGWGVEEDRALSEALENTMRLSPPRMYKGIFDCMTQDRSLGDFMNPMKPLDTLPAPPMSATITAIPNTDGAVAMFYPGVMERISAMAGGDYYIVFTAKDEAHIHLPGTTTVPTLRSVLRETNLQFPADMLTSNIYFYDSKKKQMRRV